jgi:hypothetical protein
MSYILCSAIWYKDLPTMRLLPKNCNNCKYIITESELEIISQLNKHIICRD